MPDICTLIVATSMTLQLCYSPVSCSPSRDNTKTLCVGGTPTSCPGVPTPHFECKREDGTSYIWADENLESLGLRIQIR